MEYIKNPYPGIRSFEIEEHKLFFGREKQVNELLRHQLKKYIGAVQLLRRDGIGSSEGLSTIGENCGETAPQPSTVAPDLRDYYHEAEAYESKLIQVTFFLFFNRKNSSGLVPGFLKEFCFEDLR